MKYIYIVETEETKPNRNLFEIVKEMKHQRTINKAIDQAYKLYKEVDAEWRKMPEDSSPQLIAKAEAGQKIKKYFLSLPLSVQRGLSERLDMDEVK